MEKMRKLTIGIASYGNLEKLKRTIESLVRNCTTDWNCVIVDNPTQDLGVRSFLEQLSREDKRMSVYFNEENEGYAGAVNTILEEAETEYIAYCDNDIEILTPGWDELLCRRLDMFHEIGMIFPNGGAYMIDRGSYTEIMWGVGFCWVLNRMCLRDAGIFDTALGHQEEADYCLRVRMHGWKCAALPQVQVRHDATATSDPAGIERINQGVRNWVNKWNRYFNGANFNYHSTNVTRWEDWPPNALYLEEWWKSKLPGLNDAPETVVVDGREYDLIKVPRYKGFYRGRVI